MMMAKLAFILCGSLQLAVLCSAIPLKRRTVEAAMQPPARFDAGPVNSCEIPATNFCSVDYSVPTSVARSLTLVIEEEIRNHYEWDKANGLECAQALRDIRCAQRFPRCSINNTQVTVSSLNCTEMISACPGNIQMMLQAEGFCTLGSTSVLGECKPVTEYGYQFRHCPMGSSDNWYVTRWMHDVMVHADVQLAARFNGTALSSINTECRRKYATYLCQFMGRCTSHVEPRVEVVNAYEQCEDVINCFPDWLANTFRAILPCSQWPNQHGPVSSPPPSSPSVATDLTTEPVRSIWPNPTLARFDAGPVNSCEIPATNFCSVNYSVPTSVARSLTLVIEEEIRNHYEWDKANGLECAQALRDIRCAQRFPRCSADNAQVTLSSMNCTEMISVCPRNIQMALQAEGFCTLGSITVLGECKAVTEYGHQFQHCPMGSSDSWYVTRWMHDIMVHADVQLAARFNGTALSSINTECRRKYATYLCQFMGRCTSHAEPRVEVVNTYEMCEDVINCFPDWLANTFRAILPCSQWPNQHGLVSSPPPSSPSVATDLTTEPMRSTWPNPTFIVDTDQFPVSSPPPESSSPPVATDQTTEPPSGSSSDDNTLRTTATVKSTWPNPTFIEQFPVSSPPPEFSSPPVVTDQTTEPPSGSSSDDNTLRTTATVKSTWPNPTFIEQLSVSSPPPEFSSPPVATDQTTEPPSGSSSDDNTLRTTATVKSTWPNPTFIEQLSVSSPPPEFSSPPVVTDQTTEPPSGSSSDDNTLRTTATVKSTWPNPTFVIDKDQFVTGAASFHSVCIWMLLFLTILAIVAELV